MEDALCSGHSPRGCGFDSRPPDLRECGVMAARMLREHEEAFESHIFDLAVASAYKENRHSLRMAVNTNKHIDNLISNIREHSLAGRAPGC